MYSVSFVRVTNITDYLPIIDLNDYDFTTNPEIWDYRKLDGLNETMSPADLELIEQVESELKGIE